MHTRIRASYKQIPPLLGGLLYVLANTAVAVAHTGEPPAPHDFWQSWPWEPWVLLGLLVGGLWYARGVTALWRRAGAGRGVTRRQVWLFGIGLGVVALALLTPLAALSEALFAAHMVQHILLMNVAAPLLIWGMSPVLFLWALPLNARLGIGRWWQHRKFLHQSWHWLTQPLVVWTIYALMLWGWHAPRLYQAAIAVEWIHLSEHLCFMASALLFWWVLSQPSRPRSWQIGGALLFLFTTAVHSGLLAAIITFAPRPLYPIYAANAWAWGLTTLSDQQLAGVIMWVPVGFVYLGALLWRLGKLLTQPSESELVKAADGSERHLIVNGER